MSNIWTQTSRDIRFDLAEPNPDDVDMEDIAHALSQICRFTGHTKVFYSVAQHSCLACKEAVRRNCHSDVVKWALMHDTAEAYTGDISRPVRNLLGTDIAEIEGRIYSAIVQRFNLPFMIPEEVFEIDNALLHTEALQLLGEPAGVWEPMPPPLDIHITPWTSKVAYQTFIAKAELLGIE